MIINYKDYLLEIFNDDTYTIGTVDNVNKYEIEYIIDKSDYLSNKLAIKINKDEIQISSAIIFESGGTTRPSDKSYLIKNDSLAICCGNMIYSVRIPDLKINWKAELDTVTCFAIYDFEDDFIIHGECEISRVTDAGHIKWQFSAKDIFVNLNGRKEFDIQNGLIKLVDFGDDEYVLDPATGKVIL
jgi:hypothetical protein